MHTQGALDELVLSGVVKCCSLLDHVSGSAHGYPSLRVAGHRVSSLIAYEVRRRFPLQKPHMI